MTSLRLSYASSPESDLEQGASLSPRLVKCSSDPSIATQEDNNPPAPPPYSPPTQYNQVRIYFINIYRLVSYTIQTIGLVQVPLPIGFIQFSST